MSARAIAGVLHRQPIPVGAPKQRPGQRTIGRTIKEFEGKSAEEKRLRDYFSWPKSMLDGALPWEASRAALDLMRFNVESGYSPRSEQVPVISEVRWFWRVTQAIPDADIKTRVWIATWLHFIETFYGDAEMLFLKEADSMAALQWILAFQTWRSEDDRHSYEAAVTKGAPLTHSQEAADWFIKMLNMPAREWSGAGATMADLGKPVSEETINALEALKAPKRKSTRSKGGK